MNIFYIHKDPEVAAKAMTNKHVIKMILESAQLLCTAHRVLDGTQIMVKSKSGHNLKKWQHDNPDYDKLLYKSTHVNHPSAIWVRESSENYTWLYKHFIALGNEYKQRYSKTHKSIEELRFLLASPPKNIPHISQTPVRIAITNSAWHKSTPVESYRAYYINEKINTAEDLKRYESIIGS
jgi:hypothetical protein